MPTVTSPFGQIKWKEILEGGIYAAVVPAIEIALSSLDAGELTFNTKAIAVAAISGFLAFMLKKLATPAQLRVKGLDANTLADIKTGKKIVKIEDKKVA
jgi:membrane protein implicated in regulation of membrane protease activity